VAREPTPPLRPTMGRRALWRSRQTLKSRQISVRANKKPQAAFWPARCSASRTSPMVPFLSSRTWIPENNQFNVNSITIDPRNSTPESLPIFTRPPGGRIAFAGSRVMSRSTRRATQVVENEFDTRKIAAPKVRWHKAARPQPGFQRDAGTCMTEPGFTVLIFLRTAVFAGRYVGYFQRRLEMLCLCRLLGRSDLSLCVLIKSNFPQCGHSAL
jgi:hypothetical protein